jgi:hypothetical protein
MCVPISVISWLRISSVDCWGSSWLIDTLLRFVNGSLCAAVWRSACKLQVSLLKTVYEITKLCKPWWIYLKPSKSPHSEHEGNFEKFHLSI